MCFLSIFYQSESTNGHQSWAHGKNWWFCRTLGGQIVKTGFKHGEIRVGTFWIRVVTALLYASWKGISWAKLKSGVSVPGKNLRWNHGLQNISQTYIGCLKFGATWIDSLSNTVINYASVSGVLDTASLCVEHGIGLHATVAPPGNPRLLLEKNNKFLPLNIKTVPNSLDLFE